MKKKITSKQHKELQEKAALLQRINDVYSGSIGMEWNSDEQWANAENLSTAVPALESIFGHQVEVSWVWKSQSLKHFDTPESACEFLYSQGFRA